MRYFKLITRIDHADIDETQRKGEGETWSNTMTISDINGCQKKRLVDAFKPLVERNSRMLIELAKKALWNFFLDDSKERKGVQVLASPATLSIGDWKA